MAAETELTLEKARVVERLSSIEEAFNKLNTQVQVLLTESSSFRKVTSDAIIELKLNQGLLTKIINGNGTVGLVGKMDAVEKSLEVLHNEGNDRLKARVEHRWLIGICILTAIFGVVGQIIVNHWK